MDKDNESFSMSIGQWVSNELISFRPDREVFLQAARHLIGKTIARPSSNSSRIRQISVGKLYESAVYECLRELTKRDPEHSLVAKGADVSPCRRTVAQLRQDGLFYDEKGDIVARGDGQDLSEFDSLVLNRKNEIALIEAKNSKMSLKDLNETTTYKKRLVKYLFSRQVQFVLASPLNIENDPYVKQLLCAPGNFFASTPWLEELSSLLNQKELLEKRVPSAEEPRLVYLSDFRTPKIHYLKVHNVCRHAIIEALKNNRKPILPDKSWLIERIVIGHLSELSVAKLLQESNVLVDEKRLTVESFSQFFSRIVLSLSMPESRPVLYLRLRSTPVYLKLGPLNTFTFEFERNIFPRTTYFRWLENMDFEIDQPLMSRILHEYLNENVAGLRRKIGELEKFKEFAPIPWKRSQNLQSDKVERASLLQNSDKNRF
jgi:hypothetical protein